MFAADVRHRAADDGCFLLPAGRSVKGPEDGRQRTDRRGVVMAERRNFCPPSSVLRHLSSVVWNWQEWREYPLSGISKA